MGSTSGLTRWDPRGENSESEPNVDIPVVVNFPSSAARQAAGSGGEGGERGPKGLFTDFFRRISCEYALPLATTLRVEV